MKKPNEKHTAYHEAGHVVILVKILGKKFENVTIVPYEDEFGTQYGGRLLTNPDPVYYKDYDFAMFLLAGYVAEAKISKCQILCCVPRDDSPACDWTKAMGVLDECIGRNQCDYIIKDLRKYLKFYWKHVEAIANALIKKKTLTYDEVKEILDN
jgi:ATP-dependent Zn protease